MTVVSRVQRCGCKCHANHDDTSWKYGVDSRSHLACILACDECRRNHEAALYSDDPPSRPLGDTSTAWNEQGDGEGRED